MSIFARSRESNLFSMTDRVPQVLLVTREIPSLSIRQLESLGGTLHYYPSGPIPSSVLTETEAWLTGSRGIPFTDPDFSSYPNLKLVQITSAGANLALSGKAIVDCLAKGEIPPFQLGTASGIHTDSISQYIIGTLLMILNGLGRQVVHAQVRNLLVRGKLNQG